MFFSEAQYKLYLLGFIWRHYDFVMKFSIWLGSFFIHTPIIFEVSLIF